MRSVYSVLKIRTSIKLQKLSYYEKMVTYVSPMLGQAIMATGCRPFVIIELSGVDCRVGDKTRKRTGLVKAQGVLRRFPLSQFRHFFLEGLGLGASSQAFSKRTGRALSNRLHPLILERSHGHIAWQFAPDPFVQAFNRSFLQWDTGIAEPCFGPYSRLQLVPVLSEDLRLK